MWVTTVFNRNKYSERVCSYMQVPKQIIHLIHSPFQKLPESRLKHQIRVRLWRYLSASVIGPYSLHLSRRYLIISPGDHVFMIGCGSKNTLTQVADLIGPSGSILITEADKSKRKKLRSTQVAPDLKVDKRIAWSKTGEVQANKIAADGLEEGQLVKVADLQTMVKDHSFTPDYIELAINGYEPEVLSAGKNLLFENQTKLLIKNFGHGFGHPLIPNRAHMLLEILEEADYEYEFAPSRPILSKIGAGQNDGDILAWDPMGYDN